MKKKRKFDIVISILGLLIISVFVWVVYNVVYIAFPIDLSQEYRKIPEVENIVFHENWGDKYFKRSFWGLKEIENPVDFQENEGGKALEVPFLKEVLDEHDWIEQAVTSPNGKYILYCEIQYGYKDPGGGMTDDEYCYYRVYNIDTGEVVAIYEGYRKWFEVCWNE